MAANKKRGGWKNTAAAENGKRGGRPPKAERKKDKSGRIAIRIDPAQQMVINATPEDQALAMRLMLNFPEVATVQDLPMYALRRLAEQKEGNQMQYDKISYDNAQAAAERMTDEQLKAAHADYLRRDGVLLAGGESRLGLVDDPYWSYIKHEMRRRNLA